VRLRRFSVTGYKNLEQPIVLDDLGSINVIHGANNVGKSNLLQAMDLFFRCIMWPNGGMPFGENEISSSELLISDLRPLFHLERPLPIVLGAVLDVRPEELLAAGIQTDLAAAEIDVEITLEWRPPNAARCTFTRVRFGGAEDVAREKDVARYVPVLKLLARNLLVSGGPTQRFALVGVRRSIEEDPIPRDAGPAPLVREMYDCRESLDRVRRDRWRAFVRAMGELRDITGEGTFEVTYPREEGVSPPARPESGARLVFDTETMRIPFSLLGTGVQQVAALLGHALMRNASIVGIEEPELNLRWALQNRLRETFRRLVAEPHGSGGVDQIFLTSHSPAFEAGESFWLMEAGPRGPSLSRRPVSALPAVLGAAPDHLGLPERAPQAYVTSQGVVRLPPRVIERLHVDEGGGVFFVEAEPRGVRILSNEEYLDELGLADDTERTDDRR